MDFDEFMAAKYPDIEPSGIVFLAMKATWNACKEEAAKVAEGYNTVVDLSDLLPKELFISEVETDFGKSIAKAIRELK